MSDPAAEAAQRAHDNWDWSDNQSVEVLVQAAAHEALKPIRQLHAYWYEERELPPEAWQILDALAPLIYTAEELAR